MERSVPAMEGLEARVLLSGAPILVDTFNDVVDEYDGLTSLREAIALAAAPDSGDDVIQLPTGYYALTEGQLPINDTSGNLSIVGIDGLAVIDAQNASRVMEIAAGSNVQLTQLGITGGFIDEEGSGGGIYTEGNVSLENCEMYENFADYSGGGIYAFNGTLTLTNSTLTGNTAYNSGGGVYANTSTLNLTNSTLAGNTAEGNGGGIFGDYQSTLNLVNATLTENTAGGNGGGIYNGPLGIAVVTNVTLAGNTATTDGGGIYNGGALYLDNTILAGNSTESEPNDLSNYGTVESRLGGGPTNNLIESPDGHAILDGVDGNIVGQTALLGDLAENGGPTLTMLPQPGSPAIHAGNDAVWSEWTTQQAASGGYAGEWSSLVLDADGNAHIATYQSGGARLYSNTTGSWVGETIDGYGYGDGEQGRRCEMIMDAEGNLHATYRHENEEGDIRYATNASGTWQAVTLSTEGVISSPALDSLGNLYVAYDTSNSDFSSLWLATNASGAWQNSEIDSDGYVWCPSLAIDGTDHMHVAYFDAEGDVLKYATNASGEWQITVVDGEISVALRSQLSLALDPDGYVHIVYHNDDGNSIHYATNRPGDWVTTVIDDDGVADEVVDIAVDAGGAVHVCYGRDDYSGLRYATNRSGAWKVYEFASDLAGQGYRPSIAVDSAGRVHVAYAHAESHLHYGVISWAVNSDQRGEGFSRFVNTIDIGAVEIAALPQGEGYYEIWGGNTDYRDGGDDDWTQTYYNIDQAGDYVYLGGSMDASCHTSFSGQYDYYVIATRARVQVDSVIGGDGEYGYSNGDGNTFGWDNLYGPPDGEYTTVGYQGNSEAFCGFLIIENPNEWDGLTVHTGNIDLPLHVNISQSADDGGTGEFFEYEHGVSVEDQGWSTSFRFCAPSGVWYDMWPDDDGSGWGYWNESFPDIPTMESEFGTGWYTIEASGGPFGVTTTQLWFGEQDSEDPLAWPTQIPEITNIAPNQADVPTDTTIDWSPITDPNVTGVYADVEDVSGNRVWFWSSDPEETTSFGPAELNAATNYDLDLEFQNHHGGITPHGYGYHVARYTETSVLFRTEGEPSDVQPNLVMGETFYTPGVYRPGDEIVMDFLLGNLGEGNAVAVGEDGFVDPFYQEIRLSFDTIWSADDVVIYRRGDVGWMGGDAFDTRYDPSPKSTWPGGLPTIPQGVERGNYYVLVGFDVLNQVAESDETDNLWVSASPDVSVETLVGVVQPKHVLSVGVANPAVQFRGDIAAKRVNQAFEGMEGLVTNLLMQYHVNQAGNQDHLLDVLAWFRSRVLPGDQFIFYVAAQACHTLEGNEVAVDAQYNTAAGKWNLTRTTTGDEYLYLSAVDGMSNWLSDDKLALNFFDSTWAAANKVFILDMPYAGGFIGMENPVDESQWDLSLLRYDPAEEMEQGQTLRTQQALGTVQIIAAAGEGQFAFMTPERPLGWAGVNRMGTHMIAPILAQVGPEHDTFDIEQLFWQTNETNSLYCNDVGMLFPFAEGRPDEEDGTFVLDGPVFDPITGQAHVQLGADVKAVRYVDTDGSVVVLKLTNGTADLTFRGVDFQQTFAGGVMNIRGNGGVLLETIQLIDTTANDTLIFYVFGGNGYAVLGGITGQASLSRLAATKVDLVGEGIQLTGQGVINLIQLHNICNGADVVMAGAGPAVGVRIFAASIGQGTDIQLAGAVYAMNITRWAGGSLQATRVYSLRVASDMGADVNLTETDAWGRSIFSAYVFGSVTGGAWNLAGGLYFMYVRGNLIDSAIHFTDARMIRVIGRVDSSHLSSRGNVQFAIVGAMRDSTFFAGVREDYDIDADGDGVLDLPGLDDLLGGAGRIGQFLVRGVRGVANAFENSNLAAGSFGSVLLQSSSLVNPVGSGEETQPFGLLTGGGGVGRLRLILNRRSYFWFNQSWTGGLNPEDLSVIQTA